MTTRDLENALSAVHSIDPKAHTADVNGDSADLLGYDSAAAVINVGTWTDGTHTFEVQESDDDSTFTAVADADLSESEPVVDGADDDQTTYMIGYTGEKRYIRVVATVTGATTGAEYGAVILRGHAHQSPA